MTRPDVVRPFRMWLYPVPALVAIAGFVFILFNRANWQKEIRYAVVILLVGLLIYMIRAWKDSEWPFGPPTARSLPQGTQRNTG
jgi:L-asparagine transporter-like permease